MAHKLFTTVFCVAFAATMLGTSASADPPAPSISPAELHERMDAGGAPLVIDVREGWELDISKVPFAQHVPMAQVPNRVGEFDANTPIIVMCRSGERSLQVANFLESHGFR